MYRRKVLFRSSRCCRPPAQASSPLEWMHRNSVRQSLCTAMWKYLLPVCCNTSVWFLPRTMCPVSGSGCWHSASKSFSSSLPELPALPEWWSFHQSFLQAWNQMHPLDGSAAEHSCQHTGWSGCSTYQSCFPLSQPRNFSVPTNQNVQSVHPWYGCPALPCIPAFPVQWIA